MQDYKKYVALIVLERKPWRPRSTITPQRQKYLFVKYSVSKEKKKAINDNYLVLTKRDLVLTKPKKVLNNNKNSRSIMHSNIITKIKNLKPQQRLFRHKTAPQGDKS